MVDLFHFSIYNVKIGSTRKELFYSVDEANMNITDTLIVISFKNASVVLITAPQTKFAEVMSSPVSVCPQEGGCLSTVEGKNCTQRPAAKFRMVVIF